MAGSDALRRLRNRVSVSLRRGGGAGPQPPGADGSGADDGGIRVVYAPERDGDPDPGEVVWTWVPYEDDPSEGKDRPVLLLGWEGTQLVAVQLSSKDHSLRADAHEWLPVGTEGWDRERRPSYVDASRLLRIDPRSVRREGSALDPDRFASVLARVRELHGWTA